MQGEVISHTKARYYCVSGNTHNKNHQVNTIENFHLSCFPQCSFLPLHRTIRKTTEFSYDNCGDILFTIWTMPTADISNTQFFGEFVIDDNGGNNEDFSHNSGSIGAVGTLVNSIDVSRRLQSQSMLPGHVLRQLNLPRYNLPTMIQQSRVKAVFDMKWPFDHRVTMQGMRRYRFRVFALQPIQSGITNTIDKLSNSNNLNGSTYVVAGEILTESFDVVFTPFGGPPSLSLPLEQTSTVQSNKEHTSTTHQEESMKRLPTELEMNLDTEIDAFLSDSTYQRSLDTYFRLDLSIDDQNDFKENSAHASHTCTSTSSIRNLNQFLRKSYGDIRLDTMDGQTIHSDMFSSYDASVLPILPAHDSIPLLPTRVLNTHPAISAQRLYRINQTTHDRINIDNDDHNMQQELASGATALPSTLTDSSLFIPLLTESTLLDLSLSVVRLPVRRVPPSAVDPWAPFIDSRLYKHCRKRQLSSVGCCPCMHSTL